MLATEIDVLNFWDDNHIFKKSVEQNKDKKPFIFLDSPFSATDLPKYSQIFTSLYKDSILRYYTQKGRYTPRRWGWDCHGSGIEILAEQKLGVKDKRDIENKIGVERFNHHCKDIAMTHDEEWRRTMHRIGNWTNMNNLYRTMDNDFIESSWWGLGQLWKKGLLYKDYQIGLYSPSVGIPLSHTDASMEVRYEDTVTETPVIKFRVKEDSSKKLIRKILEEIALNYSEQLRSKNELEKRLKELTNLGSSRNASSSEIMRGGTPEFSAINWQNFKSSGEIVEEMKSLKEQYETIMENIETLAKLKDVLTKNYNISLLSWSTTPWCFPANVALAVGRDIEYVVYYLGASSELVIIAEKRAVPILSIQLHQSVINSTQLQLELNEIEDSGEYFSKLGVEITKIVSFMGSDLEGLEYKPLFELTENIESYEQKANLYRVYTSDSVSENEGTGIIQISPAYGVLDFELKKERNLAVVTCLNEYGEMRNDLNPELKATFGKNFLECNSIILEILARKSLVFNTFSYQHKVPIYQRDDKQVYHSAQESWFISENKLKPRILELNNSINWHSNEFNSQDFAKDLQEAPDWSISRNRYWGNPIPLWQTKNQNKTIFIDSLDKLEKFAINPIYKILNHRDLNPSIYEEGKTVIFTDSSTKLPLGINATQYRSKNLTEMRKSNAVNISHFALVAQKILDEILKLFEKYKVVQILFEDREQVFWTTWLNGLHSSSKKYSKNFYFYKKVEKDIEGYTPTGSIKMLDLHRPYIDEIWLRDEIGDIYYRIEEVLDSWVEGGYVPFASHHYPFENKELVENSLPANWVGEDQTQTKGWLRALHVLSTGIFNEAAFEEVSLSGSILSSENGQKINNNDQDFGEPNLLIEKYGSDSVRNYLLSSPLLKGESINFREKELEVNFRETTLLITNSLKYVQFVFSQYTPSMLKHGFKHPLNKWWYIYTLDYVKNIDKHLSSYNIVEASKLIQAYIHDLSSWYIRRSKDLLQNHGFEVATCLKESMILFAVASSSLQPFNTERIWSIVKDEDLPDSVHLSPYPEVNSITDKQRDLLYKISKIREITAQIHTNRREKDIRPRQPLYADFSLFNVSRGMNEDISQQTKDILRQVTSDNRFSQERNDQNNILLIELIKKECNLIEADLSRLEGEMCESKSEFGLIKVDLVIDKSLSVLGYTRDFERSVQDFRKKQGFKSGEIVKMHWQITKEVDEETTQLVLEKVDWAKLCVEVKWVPELLESSHSIEIKDLCTILVSTINKYDHS